MPEIKTSWTPDKQVNFQNFATESQRKRLVCVLRNGFFFIYCVFDHIISFIKTLQWFSIAFGIKAKHFIIIYVAQRDLDHIDYMPFRSHCVSSGTSALAILNHLYFPEWARCLLPPALCTSSSLALLTPANCSVFNLDMSPPESFP